MESHPLRPVFLSPALPSDLLQFIINRCSYPTTLIICSDRAEFLSSLTQDITSQQQQQQRQRYAPNTEHDTTKAHPDSETTNEPPHYPPPNRDRPHPLLTAPLSQLAATRHIRTVFVPTVTHLRAFLSVFPLSSTPAPAPAPAPAAPAAEAEAEPQRHRHRQSSNASKTRRPPRLLVVYGFLALHRHTSEWSVQGLGTSAAALVEAARRQEGVRAAVVEPAAVPAESTDLGSAPAPAFAPAPSPAPTTAPAPVTAPATAIATASVAALGSERGQQQPEQEQEQAEGEEAVDGGYGREKGEGEGEGGGGVVQLLQEPVPVLSGTAARRAAGGAAWAGKTVHVGRVLGRWFQFDGEGRTEW